MEILIFTLGSKSFGIPVQDIAFVDSKADNFKEESKGTGFIKGITVIRELLMPVYSLALRLGFTEQNLKYLIVIKINGANVGIEVDTVDGVIIVAEEEIMPFPALIDGGQCCFKSIVVQGMKLTFVLDVNSLMCRKEENEITAEAVSEWNKKDLRLLPEEKCSQVDSVENFSVS